MAAAYHLRIKKAYAAAVIEDLERLDAIELYQPESDDNPITGLDAGQLVRPGEPLLGIIWSDVLEDLRAMKEEL